MMKKLLLVAGIVFATIQSFSQALIISEFRLRGLNPNGATNEFVEIYNNSNAAITVSGGGTGFALAASDGITRFVIPNGTVIPARGHYLGVNSTGYSLASYPAGVGTTATGDASYTTDIADNAGIALFNTSIQANFTLANRLDAVGSTSEANTLYKEGTGYPPINPTFNIDHSFHRKTYTGLPQDTNDNAADFKFEDTNGTSAGAGQFLGAAGPENLSSPINLPSSNNLLLTLADPVLTNSVNFSREYSTDPANNSSFGTISLRVKVVNNTGASITRLRLRIDTITTFPAPSNVSDLRPRTSSNIVVNSTTYQATTLEQPPSQLNGGGGNSSLSVTLGSPLATGATAYLNLLFGVQQAGNFKIILNTESLPSAGGSVLTLTGTSDVGLYVQPTAAPLIISEFRLRGLNPNGATNEYVEIYNNSDTAFTVAPLSGTALNSSGYSLVASDGTSRFIIPNGTVIPARGHYLGANSTGYALAGYAAADITFTTDIPDNAGIALFNTSIQANFTLANRLDAVGSTSEANTLYKEGTGYPSITPTFNIDHCFHRKSYTGLPQDTNDNAPDFKFEDTNGTSAGAGQFLGAPGPENMNTPINLPSANNLPLTLANPVNSNPVNFSRDFTQDAANNSSYGTISLKLKIVNNTGVSISRFRLRIDTITTFPALNGTADLRPRTSSDVVVNSVTYKGVTLEQPPSQLNGGGNNSSLSLGSVSLGSPLSAGATTYINLLFGVQQTGNFKIILNGESLPAAGGNVLTLVGNSDAGFASIASSYFRTRQSGNWNDVNTWESSSVADFSAGLISPATLTPDFNSNAITIQNGHTVTSTVNITTDQTTINSGGSLVINPGVILTLNDGTGTDLTVSGGASITIRSTAAGTGSIGNSTTATISGNVTVERYLSNRRAWRLLGIPFSSGAQTIKSSWMEGAASASANPSPGYGTAITTFTGDANAANFDATKPASSIRTYSADNFNSDAAHTPNTTNLVTVNSAYFLFVRGDRSVDRTATTASSEATLRITGTVQTGSFTKGITGTSFSLVPNPYPSAIDFDAIKAIGANSGITKFYVWDATLGTIGQYRVVDITGSAPSYTYTATPGGASNSWRYVESGTSFFIPGNATMSFTEAVKSAGTPPSSMLRTSPSQQAELAINLNIVNADKSVTPADGVREVFDNNYASAVDNNDAKKIEGFDLNLGIAKGKDVLAIEKRPLPSASDVIILKLWNTATGNYQFEVDPSNVSSQISNAYLYDNYLDVYTSLDLKATTTSNFSITSEAASAAANRFSIVFSKPGMINTKPEIVIYPNPVQNGFIKLQMNNMPKGNYSIRLINNLGQTIISKQINHPEGTSIETINVNKITGAYMLEIVKPDNTKTTNKLIIN